MTEEMLKAESPIRRKNVAAFWAMILGLAAALLWWSMALGFSGLAPMGCGLIGFALVPLACLLGIAGFLGTGRRWMALLGLFGCALTIPIIFGFVQFDFSRVTAARRASVQARLEYLSSSLSAFRKDVGRYPTTGEGLAALLEESTTSPQWHGPYVDVAKYFYPYSQIKWNEDAWMHPYNYKCPGTVHPDGFDLTSSGPDGEAGTSDDITAP